MVNSKKVASTFQIERDEIVFLYVKKQEETKLKSKIDLLNDYVDFNASVCLPCLVPLFIRIECIDFVLRYNSELKRRLSIIELIEISKMFNLVKYCKSEIKGFKDLKKKYNQIKP